MSMTRNYFVFDGKSSAEFGTWVAASNAWDGAEHDEEIIEIPGRNGAIVFDNGRWRNFTAEVSCYMPKAMQTNVDGLRAFLSCRHGYCRYEETIKPDEFRLARFLAPFSLSEHDRVGAAFTLQFDCKPQRFLKSGEVPVVFTSSGSIYNPTEYDAKPLIRVYGGGTLSVGETWMWANGTSTDYIDIDCELMEAYCGDTNLNSQVGTPNGFPVLSPGKNGIYFTDFTRVEITPRWWRI